MTASDGAYQGRYDKTGIELTFLTISNILDLLIITVKTKTYGMGLMMW